MSRARPTACTITTGAAPASAASTIVHAGAVTGTPNRPRRLSGGVRGPV